MVAYIVSMLGTLLVFLMLDRLIEGSQTYQYARYREREDIIEQGIKDMEKREIALEYLKGMKERERLKREGIYKKVK